ncbi:MAG: 2-phopspho-L-lactate transferase [Actinomycetota bacterium]
MISVLAGGVGAARFLRGLCLAVDPQRVVAVVNTGDDTELHGLAISPDIDTVIYTLAGAIDPERGWGLRDETWRAMASLERFVHVRPARSNAAPTWFNLGDQDEVTDEIRRSFEVKVRVLPMTNDKVRTLVNIAPCDSPVSGETISFQEYFVAHRHSVPVESVTFEGARTAVFNTEARLQDAERIIIAPSNPIVSIGPLRALSGVDDVLRARRDDVVAVSPIVAGAALKGPADRMLRELGMEPSVVGVARLYTEVCGTLVIDSQDAHLASRVEAEGMRCVVTNTIMSDPDVARELAALTLA